MLVLVQDTWECIKTVTVLGGVRQGVFSSVGIRWAEAGWANYYNRKQEETVLECLR